MAKAQEIRLTPPGQFDPESPILEKPQNNLPPNGGLKAWLQVVSAFCIWFNTWGLLAAFGVYQEYYESIALSSPSNISWIGSLQGAVLLFPCLIVGYLYDLGYLRTLLWVGHVLLVLGMLLTSFSSQYWHFVLTQGVMVGLGASCLFLPSVSIVQQYFTSRKSLATGLAGAGNAIGGIVFPVVFRALLPAVSFGWTTRVLALICFVFSIPPVLFMRRRTAPLPGRAILLDTSLFFDAPYLCYCAAFAFAYAGIYVGLFYLPTFALTVPRSNPTLASAILVLANAGSVLGRVAPGILADYTGSLNLMIPFGIGMTALGFAWMAVSDTAGLIVWAIIYGAVTSGVITLSGPSMVAFTPDLRKIGARFGWFGPSCGVGMLIATPIAGRILETDAGWIGVQVWTGVLLFGAVSFMTLARTLKVGFDFGVKI